MVVQKLQQLSWCLLLLVLVLGEIAVCSEYSLIRTGNTNFVFSSKEGNVASVDIVNFKPKYGWMGNGKAVLKGDEKSASLQCEERNNLVWTLGFNAQGDKVIVDASLRAVKDTPLTYCAFTVKPEDMLYGGKAVFALVGGKTFSTAIPINPSMQQNVTGFSLLDKSGNEVMQASFSSAANIHMHGNIRIKFAEDKIKAGQEITNRIVLKLNKAVKFYPDMNKVPNRTDYSDWFAFTPKSNTEPGEIGMQQWMGLPQSDITVEGGDFISEGRKFKVWGTNVEYRANAPTHEDAEKRAAFFAKFGINGVRLHKLSNPGWQGFGSKESAAEYDKEGLERFDYFTNELRKNGIRYAISPIWRLKVWEGDRDQLLAYDEIKKTEDTIGLEWFAKDVQDLHIKKLLALMNHKNPYSGLRYADDPAVLYVEIQNEDDIFFYTTMPKIVKCPTYYKMFCQQFSQWLKKKYGSQKTLAAAWGAAMNSFHSMGVKKGESLDRENVFPSANPWLLDSQTKKGPNAIRLRDTAQFLYESQNNYYKRVTQALREAGYKGALVGSNWQAGSQTGHFLNLMSDAEVGVIDRHNYMGGASGRPAHTMKNGHKLENITVLNDPGSGLLSTGMQQVAGHPFVLSEWLAIPPAEWVAADTAIIAAYGLGLQGWDMSYHFASNSTGFSPTLQFPGEKKFNNLTPVGVGLYPVLSRMVLRGDIKEAEPVAIRRLNLKQALTQTYDFENKTAQQHDLKSFSGTPSHNALAAGRVLVEFTQEPGTSTIEDWKAKYKTDDTIYSNTGQLKWTATGQKNSGYFVIDTPATQGVIGFSGKQTFDLSDMSITTTNPYSLVMATAKSMDKNLGNDQSVILLAISRCHNSGMNISDNMIFEVGKGPMLLEPVKADITFKRKNAVVTVLDHDGMKTGKAYTLKDGQFSLDTGRDKSMYYLVEFK